MTNDCSINVIRETFGSAPGPLKRSRNVPKTITNREKTSFFVPSLGFRSFRITVYHIFHLQANVRPAVVWVGLTSPRRSRKLTVSPTRLARPTGRTAGRQRSRRGPRVDRSPKPRAGRNARLAFPRWIRSCAAKAVADRKECVWLANAIEFP